MISTDVVKDPVCGMDIEKEAASGQSEYQKKTFYFCGPACRETFDLDPEQYAGEPGGQPSVAS